MTRILCITANYPPHHTGGYEVSCYDVMTRLVERGHDVTVLTSDERLPGAVESPNERAGAPAVRRDLRRYFRDDDLWAPPLWVRWRVERDNQRAIAAALEASRPDVIAVWHVGAFSLGVLTKVIETGVPIVYAVCDDWLAYCTVLDQWVKAMRRLGPLAKPLAAVLRVPTVAPELSETGPVCYVSELTKRRNEQYAPYTFTETTIVHSGIDRTLFTPRPVTPPWRWRLLYAGRFDPRKGVETLIRALAKLPSEATLVLKGWGDEAEQQRLRDVARELGVDDRVDFGRVGREDLPAVYAEADVVVFPSVWDEPFGLVPIEAMACGVPVVGTGAGGSALFLVDGSNCLRFAAADADDLAAMLQRLAGDRELRDRLIAEGFRTAEFFDVEALTDDFEAWYVGAAAGFPNGHPPPRVFPAPQGVADG